ncbi:ATP-binding cassette domain-containing protein [Cytobacillus sp. Hz8]|uniref:ATP-binding cassette domain-containing protein n=1 Tax=Cytobacillus sp. Hz8 TaxID=3347168 RepID=UPI0035D8389B
MSRVIFEAKRVSKIIDGNPILDEIDIKLNSGEVVAITGHNGSGKSSLLKLLAALYEPNQGNISRQVLRIGYVPEHFPENLRFKLKEYLQLLGGMNGQVGWKEDMIHWVRLFGIESYLELPLKKLSKGTKQKAGIIQALIMKPDVLLLDEPLSGLDEASQQSLIQQLLLIKKETTVIFTSHESDFVDTISDRKIVLDKGRIVSDNREVKSEPMKWIKARIPTELDISTLVDKVEFESAEIAVVHTQASESDSVLKELLLNGASILEVRDK